MRVSVYKMQSIQYTVYSIQYTVYSIQYTMDSKTITITVSIVLAVMTGWFISKSQCSSKDMRCDAMRYTYWSNGY
jgi:ABC-type transport system involved in cytochrome bd biosynthesis fused ATPase/permease subunit